MSLIIWETKAIKIPILLISILHSIILAGVIILMGNNTMKNGKSYLITHKDLCFL